jgi:hypothetical protein
MAGWAAANMFPEAQEGPGFDVDEGEPMSTRGQDNERPKTVEEVQCWGAAFWQGGVQRLMRSQEFINAADGEFLMLINASKSLPSVACGTGDAAKLPEAMEVGHLLLDALRSHRNAEEVLSSGRASEAAQAATRALQSLATRGQLQVVKRACIW